MTATGLTTPWQRSTPSARARRSLTHPRLDAWLTGWFGVAVWLGFWLLQWFDIDVPQTGLIWVAALVSGAHFVYAYRLAYRSDSALLQRKRRVLVIAPASLVAVGIAGVALADSVLGNLISAGVFIVFTTTIWHYIKQAYGVVRVGAAHAAFDLTRREAAVLRYGMYPLWLFSAARFATNTVELPTSLISRNDLVGGGGQMLLWFIAGFVALVLAATVVMAALRNRRLPPASVVAPLIATILWTGFSRSIITAALLLPLVHAVQYLPFCFAAERGLRPAGHIDRFARTVLTFALCGVLITRWLPNLAADIVPFGTGREWGVMLFVVLNLHHYLVDATIWRHDGELVPLIVGHPDAPPLADSRHAIACATPGIPIEPDARPAHSGDAAGTPSG